MALPTGKSFSSEVALLFVVRGLRGLVSRGGFVYSIASVASAPRGLLLFNNRLVEIGALLGPVERVLFRYPALNAMPAGFRWLAAVIVRFSRVGLVFPLALVFGPNAVLSSRRPSLICGLPVEPSPPLLFRDFNLLNVLEVLAEVLKWSVLLVGHR